MEIYDVVKKLLGPIDPVGETNEDERRFVNLRETCDLVDKLLSDIADVSRDRNRMEFSIQRAGLHAVNFLLEVDGFVADFVTDEEA